VRNRGPLTKREYLNVLGKYLDDAIALANMSQAELARKAGLKSSSYVSRVMKGERSVDRATLLNWCSLLQCPEWLEEQILNAAGYASERQQQAAAAPEVVEGTHQRVMEEIEKRKGVEQ
jgi:transcriptional regulator with XRE-family HTH domain